MGSVRARVLVLLTPVLLLACAQTKQAWKDLSTGTKRAFRSFGKSCPAAAEGRAVGAADADAAFGCFQKAVGAEDPELLLRIVCHARTPASCKHEPNAQTDARASVHELAKDSWTDVFGSWTEAGGKVTVYAVDNKRKTDRVSTVTVCRIAEPPPATEDAGSGAGELGWAVCDVDEMARDAARKKSGT